MKNPSEMTADELFKALELSAFLLATNFSLPMEERYLKLKQELENRKQSRREQGY